MIVRPATRDDEEKVVTLWRDCNLVVPYNDSVHDFRFALGKANSDILVAEAPGSEIAASVMVGHDGHRGWCYYLSVSPDYRYERLGRTIISAAERWLLEKEIRKMQLMVRDNNLAIIEFYKKLGYESAPRTVMQKWL
jgi:ribosomal protein S18 acetylase RimI-like enzyme